MKKITDTSNAPNRAKKDNPLNLSLCTENDRFLFTDSTYLNGEKVVYLGAKSNHKRNTKGLPNKKGEKLQKRGLSKNQSKDIRRLIRILYHIAIPQKLHVNFLTLTFDYMPTDAEAKKMLTNFFKSIKRYLDKDFHFIWIAEKQNRGAIHFHIIFIDKLRIEVIREKWQKVVHKWERTKGYTKNGTIHINIQQTKDVRRVANYVTKTVKAAGNPSKCTQKEYEKIGIIEGRIWGCAAMTKKLLKAVVYKDVSNDYKKLNEAYKGVKSFHKSKNVREFFFEETNGKILFIPAI